MGLTKVPAGRSGTTHLPNVQGWVDAESRVHEDVRAKELHHKNIQDGKCYLKIDLHYNCLPVPGSPLAGSG